jgi:hypothetical protein
MDLILYELNSRSMWTLQGGRPKCFKHYEFYYEQLPPCDFIRLIKLLPSKAYDKFGYNIEIAFLFNSPFYEFITYTWDI